ncbi:hypothetical protein N665_0081s0058 [Sinapis alba]|nr:hypothetical protein N665_0081s0058 [Sinapis alba]
MVNEGQEKINDCLENLMVMREIEIQLQQSFEVDPHVTTTLLGSFIDTWLDKWKRVRQVNIECYTDMVQEHEPRVIYYLFSPSTNALDVGNISRLENFHEEHLELELDVLDKHLRKIRGDHSILIDQLRSKFMST